LAKFPERGISGAINAVAASVPVDPDSKVSEYYALVERPDKFSQ
jgi:hypothetical protein